MEVKYSTEKPPNNIYEKCRERFGVDWDKGIIFTYGDTIYCKSPISDDLKVHEATHIRQQREIGEDIWWERYLKDKDFRLSQEVEAYKNQMEYINKNYNRNARRYLYKHIIRSMVELYDMCTEEEAKKLL